MMLDRDHADDANRERRRLATTRNSTMGQNSLISWTDHTFNPWMGCTKVSPACDHCYAEREAQDRFGLVRWGTGEPRRRTTPAYWRQPVAWNRKAAVTGDRPRVFCASWADVFDNVVSDEWRTDLWGLIRATPHLRWMLLTKRIGNATKMLPTDWPHAFPHAGLMATIANQDEWDRDFRKLMAVPAAWHGVSVEPMLGPIDIGAAKPDWIITGFESGPQRRIGDMTWVRSMRDQCKRNGIAFHHKQNGGLRGKDNGCEIDGREHKAFPAPLAA
jgi:protein gp37